MDLEQTQLLVYQHVVQLTLIDHEVERAFALAHQVAALAFDEAFTRDGLAAAMIRRASPTQSDTPPTGDAAIAATENG